jgi:hypothetical protein
MDIWDGDAFVHPQKAPRAVSGPENILPQGFQVVDGERVDSDPFKDEKE